MIMLLDSSEIQESILLFKEILKSTTQPSAVIKQKPPMTVAMEDKQPQSHPKPQPEFMFNEEPSKIYETPEIVVESPTTQSQEQLQPEVQTESQEEPQFQVQTESQEQPGFQPGVQSQFQPQTQSHEQPQTPIKEEPQFQIESKEQPQIEYQTEPQEQPQTETQDEAQDEAQDETQVESKEQPQIEYQIESQEQPQTETQDDTQGDTQGDTQDDIQDETKEQSQPEQQPAPEVKEDYPSTATSPIEGRLTEALITMCNRGNFTGALLADKSGNLIAYHNNPLAANIVAPVIAAVGESMEKAALGLRLTNANNISMDIDDNNKLAINKFEVYGDYFFLVVICSQKIDQKTELNLSLPGISLIFKEKDRGFSTPVS